MEKEFKTGNIEGVIIKNLKKNLDRRGWLCEIFREDEVEGFKPVMSYVSITYPGVKRGPHEHREQTDYFVFLGPGNFEITLWDNRSNSPTYGNKMIFVGGVDNPISVKIPPGVVHGYKNISDERGMVINLPDKLYRGHGKREEVDEIRYENLKSTVFKID